MSNKQLPADMQGKKLTPEGELMYRIIENWGNAAIMHKMEGWIREYGDGRALNQHPCIGWVKGDYDRLYDQVKGGKRTVCWVDYTYAGDSHNYRVICTCRPETMEFTSQGHGYGRATEGKVNFIELCKMLNVEWLNESPAAGREEENWVEFAEWAPTIAFFDEDTRLWELLREGEFINGQFRFTTKELYQVFKQQREKALAAWEGEKEADILVPATETVTLRMIDLNGVRAGFLEWLTRDSFLELIGGSWCAKNDVDGARPFTREEIIKMFESRIGADQLPSIEPTGPCQGEQGKCVCPESCEQNGNCKWPAQGEKEVKE